MGQGWVDVPGSVVAYFFFLSFSLKSSTSLASITLFPIRLFYLSFFPCVFSSFLLPFA
jgi:hypothetical protein